MQTIRSFLDSSRYYFDTKICTYATGFCQVDTWQDAPYFGVWANPFTFQVFTYCEGDVTRQTAENRDEFIELMKDIENYYSSEGNYGIDPGGHESLKKAWDDLGISTH